ncbi:response regulator [Paenibacillus sp. Soil750]|uniref:response regulator n=1 Tax=Paenibacillus sp. Soil750 TaxID=1736398 RepID=UPI0006F84D1D|nr:response regulator [Paenibacillus sp. Soil750]KRE70442.1 hypothetical protein ASL11_12070 [Paenibacillus sp. Soil750]
MTYKVLIIEDEKPAREVFRQMVEAGGERYEIVGEAANGKQGYALIQSEQPDFIITDITMPIWSGIDLLNEIKRSLNKMPQTIILSCHQDFHYAQQAIQLGASAYLLKDDCLTDTSLLVHTLDTLIPNIIDTHAKVKKQTELEQKLRTNDLSISRNLFLEMIRLRESDWNDYLTSICFPHSMSVHAIALVELDRKSLRIPVTNDTSESELQLWQFTGVNVLQELLQKYGFGKVISLDSSRFLGICALNHLPPDLTREITQAFHTFLKLNAFVHFQPLNKPIIEELSMIRNLYHEKQLFFYESYQTANGAMPNGPFFTSLPSDKAIYWMKTLKDAWIGLPFDADKLILFTQEAACNH